MALDAVLSLLSFVLNVTAAGKGGIGLPMCQAHAVALRLERSPLDRAVFRIHPSTHDMEWRRLCARIEQQYIRERCRRACVVTQRLHESASLLCQSLDEIGF